MQNLSLKILFAIFCWFSFAITPASAASNKFFEYAPDAWQSKRLAVSDGATPYLLFDAPKDAEMTGFDLWIDNPGSAGSVNFSLRNGDDALLASKTASVGTIPVFPGGTKFHVTWTTPANILKGQTYYLKIDTSPDNFGLYYVDRISMIEHNRDTPSLFALGAARLGSEIQNFTFKFALYETAVTNYDTPPENGETPPPATPTQIAISGARLLEATDVTARFAWTTNIASDSKVTIRSQLNPLYTTAFAYDATLELEHTVLVSGLHPNVNYFADVFSSDGDQLTLTTYTISFKTQKTVTQPPATPPTTPPSTLPVQNPPQNPNNPQNQNPQTQNNTPGISVSPGGQSGGVDISWSPAQSGEEPSGGYRVDIFDYNYQLKRQILIPSGIHNIEIDKLQSGANHAIVYANASGTFTKVAPVKDFTLTVGGGSIINKIILLSILWIAGLGGYLYWKSKRKNSTLQA